MLRKLTSAAVNSSLLAVLIVLLAGPLVLGSLLLTSQSGALGVATDLAHVAGMQPADQTSELFQVVPNTAEFAQYASFDPQPLASGNMYQTTVTFTAFAGQLATYSGLMGITNTSGQPLQLQVSAGAISGEMDQRRVWVSLARDGELGSTLLTQATVEGDTALHVSSTEGITSNQVVVGATSLAVASRSATQLHLAEPLSQLFQVGEKVYFGPAFFHGQQQPELGQTQMVEVQPGQRAVVELAVATEANQPEASQLVLPITIAAR